MQGKTCLRLLHQAWKGMWMEGSVRLCKVVLAKETWWSMAQAGGRKHRGS